jgi:hypothetical protein
MYADNTILTLKVQRDPDKETGEAFAYNQVKVIGRSPISHAHKGKWQGGDAEGVILSPLSNFGGTLDEPFGKCVQLYDVESIPERVINAPQPIRVIDAQSAEAGPTPEEIFAKEAPGAKPEAGQIRGRTSPLGEPGGPVDYDGPLGTVANDVDLTEEEIQDELDFGVDESSPL